MAPYDYEKGFQETLHLCGDPFPEFVHFFEAYPLSGADVLDLGCGQGRDALMAARHGHRVLGVDISPTGIRQMLEEAKAESLDVRGVVADLTVYEIERAFDVILLDRVLHMLTDTARAALLGQVTRAVRPEGYVLIADMAKNKEAIRRAFAPDTGPWNALLDRRGLLFLNRVAGETATSAG